MLEKSKPSLFGRGHIQSGSFTEKMTLDPIVGVNCMVAACGDPGETKRKVQCCAGAQVLNHGGCGSQSLWHHPSHPSIGGNFENSKSNASNKPPPLSCPTLVMKYGDYLFSLKWPQDHHPHMFMYDYHIWSALSTPGWCCPTVDINKILDAFYFCNNIWREKKKFKKNSQNFNCVFNFGAIFCQYSNVCTI